MRKFVVSLTLIFGVMSVMALAHDDGTHLAVKYSNGQVFDVQNSEYKVKADLEGFQLTHDRSINDLQVFVAGNQEKRLVISCIADTMLTDVEETAEAYEDLWWYFYTQDSAQTFERGRTWESNGRFFSTHMITNMHGVEVNEKHYDLFQLADGKYFHVSIKRPLYQPGDSTYMLEVLNSFELIPPPEPATTGAK